MDNTIYRKDEIVRYCKDKNVLHLGFIQHDLYEEKIKEDNWLHAKIAKVSNQIVGFDYLNEHIEKIKKKYYYECYYADVMKLEEVQLDDKFDVIVCGELIEHIENPGLMLDGIKRFMHDESILVITTPNPWSKARIKLIQQGVLENKWLNKEHVCWYSFETLQQLLFRKGFAEELFDYYYGESISDMLKDTDGILGKLKYIKRNYVLKKTKKTHYDGLFFVVKLKNI